MKKYTVTIYLTIEAKNEEEAREIAYSLDITTKNKEDEEKVFWNSQNMEIEAEGF